MTHHDALWLVCGKSQWDFEPYGIRERDGDDCSCGCKWFYKLAAKDKEELGQDWGVCTNPVSHRTGMLTFEHQGCKYFEGEASVTEKNRTIESIDDLAPEEFVEGMAEIMKKLYEALEAALPDLHRLDAWQQETSEAVGVKYRGLESLRLVEAALERVGEK